MLGGRRQTAGLVCEDQAGTNRNNAPIKRIDNDIASVWDDLVPSPLASEWHLILTVSLPKLQSWIIQCSQRLRPTFSPQLPKQAVFQQWEIARLTSGQALIVTRPQWTLIKFSIAMRRSGCITENERLAVVPRTSTNFGEVY